MEASLKAVCRGKGSVDGKHFRMHALVICACADAGAYRMTRAMRASKSSARRRNGIRLRDLNLFGPCGMGISVFGFVSVLIVIKIPIKYLWLLILEYTEKNKKIT